MRPLIWKVDPYAMFEGVCCELLHDIITFHMKSPCTPQTLPPLTSMSVSLPIVVCFVLYALWGVQDSFHVAWSDPTVLKGLDTAWCFKAPCGTSDKAGQSDDSEFKGRLQTHTHCRVDKVVIVVLLWRSQACCVVLCIALGLHFFSLCTHILHDS